MLEKDSCKSVSEVGRAEDRFYDHNTMVFGIHQQMPKKKTKMKGIKTRKTELLSLCTYDNIYLHPMSCSTYKS